MKKTSNNNKNAYIVSIIAMIILEIGLALLFFWILKRPINKEGIMGTKAAKYFFLAPVGFFFIFIFFTLVGYISALIKATAKISFENAAIKRTNPYKFFRDLPNSYGIGVSSILYNKKIDNQKDLLAVLLDLCAKGYLRINEKGSDYNIAVLKDVDDSLLKNEKYIMSLIINDNISNIDYKEWLNYCVEDAKNYGLISDRKVGKLVVPNIGETTKRIIRYVCAIVFLTILCIIIAIGISSGAKLSIANICFYLVIAAIFTAIFIPLIFVILYIPWCIVGLLSIAKYESNIIYNDVLEHDLFMTHKGVKEYHKLLAFNNFIANFGSFASKKAEEIVLWDRYLSYAQLFGLANEIMNTGYKELIHNSSFDLSNIKDNNYCVIKNNLVND